KRTDLVSFAQPQVHFDGRGDNYNGGITAYGTTRGILTFVHTEGDATDAYYWNQHTGNADDTAHAAALDGQPGISQMVTSARANTVSVQSVTHTIPDRYGNYQVTYDSVVFAAGAGEANDVTLQLQDGVGTVHDAVPVTVGAGCAASDTFTAVCKVRTALGA